MAYIYLLNLHEVIEERINLYQEPDHMSGHISGQASGAGEKVQKTGTQFQQGRIDLLNEFKTYLTDNMNDKLPKRLRNRLADSI